MIDGNKRIGVHAMLVFMKINGYDLEYSQKELIDLMLGVAEGKMDYTNILHWLIEHQK